MKSLVFHLAPGVILFMVLNQVINIPLTGNIASLVFGVPLAWGLGLAIDKTFIKKYKDEELESNLWSNRLVGKIGASLIVSGLFLLIINKFSEAYFLYMLLYFVFGVILWIVYKRASKKEKLRLQSVRKARKKAQTN